ncbi:MAG: chemotaxis protein CheW [Acutalibacter sp.]|jgi:purine-binding chemotaxis protein CheW
MNEEEIYEEQEMAEETDSRKYLIFVTDGLKLGVDAEYVVEIITNHAITYLPMLPNYMSGIINLRGQIIPIMNIRARLGKEDREDCLVIVLNIDGTQLGLLVDTVDQMIDIPKESLVPVPPQSNQRFVSSMCSLPDGSGTMMVLACQKLLAHE